MQEFIIGATFVGLMVIIISVVIRATVNMYGDKDYTGTWTSGIAGAAMGEIDRLVRPSAENVVEAKEAAEKEEDDMGGE